MMNDTLGDGGDSVFEPSTEIDEAIADFMPIADTPEQVEAELEAADFNGFREIDPDAPPADTPGEDVDDIAAALEEYGYPTDDMGSKPKEYEFKKWVAAHTDVSIDEAGKTGHYARDDMEEEGWIPSSRTAKKQGGAA